MTHSSRLISLLGLAAVAAGCGSAPERAAQPAPEPAAVKLTLVSPDGGTVTSAGRITVRGTVVPRDASVLVQGHPAAVNDGIFTGQALLRRGRTTIDIIATARGAGPGATSVAVSRRSAARKVARTVSPAPATVVVHDYAPPVVRDYAPPVVRDYAPPTTGSDCGAGVSVGPNTSCAFALNVRAAYLGHGPGTVNVYSPVTRRTYAMHCSGTAPVVCTGGKGASVYFS